MKVLFATTNPAKVGKYKEILKTKGIELITIKDLNFKLDIEESGKNAIENAYIKAKAYFNKTKMPTIGMDNNLFIEELPSDKQPGTHVRRINGKELSVETMKKYGIELHSIYEDLEKVIVHSGKRKEPLCKKVYGFDGDLADR